MSMLISSTVMFLFPFCSTTVLSIYLRSPKYDTQNVRTRNVHSTEGLTSNLPTPLVTYSGGPLVANAKLIQVNYGVGSYEPYIGNDVGTFYDDLVKSTYWSLLSEYSTTNLTIGNGSYGGFFTITPSAANAGPDVDMFALGTELIQQIEAGHLPANTPDSVNVLFFKTH